MQLTFAHLADYAVVTTDGKMTLVGLFSQINAVSIPWQHPALSIAFEWDLSYAETARQHPVSMDIVDEDGTKIFSMDGHVMLQPGPGHQPKPGEPIRLPQVFNMQNVQFNRAGRYDINFFADNRLVHTLTFEVKLSPPQSIRAA